MKVDKTVRTSVELSHEDVEDAVFEYLKKRGHKVVRKDVAIVDSTSCRVEYEAAPKPKAKPAAKEEVLDGAV